MSIPSIIYAFGDSLSDAGDAYLLTSSTYGSGLGLSPQPVSPPYYNESYGSTSTAHVFSDGKVWVQLLSEAYGDGQLAPGSIGTDANTVSALLAAKDIPSVVISLLIRQFELAQNTTGPDPYIRVIDGIAGGTDFAIGGSVTGASLENTSPAVALTGLSAQLANFENAFPAASRQAGALYTVWSGSNDLLNLLQDPSATANTPAATALLAQDIQQSVSNEVAMVHSLIGDGAQSLLVVNVPDLSKTPEVQALGAAAVTLAATISGDFNAELLNAVTTGDFNGAQVGLLDSFKLIDDAVVNKPDGLTDVTDPAYTGSFTADDGTLASNPDQYLFFDKLHPTETGHIAIEQAALALFPCFAGGTQLAVPGGVRNVETLQPGDMVCVQGGHTRPVRWVGRRHAVLAGHPERYLAQPIRVAAGAFGGGKPVRDLLLSPEHAVFLDGVLIPVRALIGSPGIARDRVLDAVTYFHVELDSHDVLFAEGLACESWLDTGNRALFENAPPPLNPAPATPCAPLLESGPVLEAIRRGLGAAPTQELRLDRPGLHEIAILPGVGAIRLASASRRAGDDARRLGAAVGALALDGAAVALDDMRLASGFHRAEAGWRWTDGAGLLTVGSAASLRVEVVAVAPG